MKWDCTPNVATAIAILLSIGCAKPAPDAGHSVSPSTRAADEASLEVEEVREAKLGDASPVHVVGSLYLAGQPRQADFPELAKRGIKTVVTLRSPGELDWNQQEAVEAAGMKFVAVPFDGAEQLTDDVFDRVRQLLRDNRGEPLMLHCARANRVGAVWMVHRVLDEGVSADQALKEAQTVGLRTPEYIERAQAYIKVAQSADAAN